jgi:hypothetical protein
MPLFLFIASLAFGHEIRTNTVTMPEAPAWLTASRVERVVDRVQSKLEWDIRRVSVRWYSDPAAFQKAHGFDASVQAFARKQDGSVHLGPKTTQENFDAVFGHELAHIVLGQKYKTAIPNWLEEGLANYVAQKGSVDYAWLATQPRRDVRTMNHPFAASAPAGARYHYQASTALIEMLAAKCSLADLLQLSVGKKLENFLATYCQIPDVNAAFDQWLQRKARAARSI